MSEGAARAGLPGLEGRRALVTGGSRGIGRATVRGLAAAGASVGLAYRSDHEAAEAALEAARRAAGSAAGDDSAGEGGTDAPDAPTFWKAAGDLAREEDVERLFARVDEEFGGLDLFVGNAGIWNQEPLPLEELSPGAWREMIETNLTSIYLTARAAALRLGEGGRMVLVSSTAAQRGEPEHGHYAASKGAVNAFCKSLAGEMGPRGVTVNAVAPGWVDTDMSASVLRTPAREEALREIPLGRIASAEDVAGPICFLLSDLARHVTGEVLNVNGGSVLCG